MARAERQYPRPWTLALAGAVSISSLLGTSCSDDDAPAGSGGSSAGGSNAGGGGESPVGGGGAAGGSEAGGNGGAPCAIVDPCGSYADLASCCGDPACGWHHNNGHQIYGVPPCVARDRVCVVAGEPILECPDGTTCLGQGVSQDTADDCTLPPDGSISLLRHRAGPDAVLQRGARADGHDL